VVEAFLERHPEFEPLEYPPSWKALPINGIKGRGPGWLLDPLSLNSDGMFVARMRRRK